MQTKSCGRLGLPDRDREQAPRTTSAMNAAVKVTRPKTSAAISGMIGRPPFILKPESFAISNPNGAPAAAHTIAGNPMISAMATAAAGACAPVRSWRRRAHSRNPAAKTSAATIAPMNQAAWSRGTGIGR